MIFLPPVIFMYLECGSMFSRENIDTKSIIEKNLVQTTYL